MNRIATFFGAGATFLLAAPFALAQDAVTGVDEIIVTAQKRSENLQQVPISILAMDAEALEASGVATIDDVTRLAPGMSMSNVGSGFVSYTYIRGAGTNVIDSGADPSVAYFLDEVYLGGTAGLQFDLVDIARIEVLKGPQGTLFGRNAAAGAVHIITQDPAAALEAKASLTLADYGLINAQAGISGPLSADGVWRFRLSGGHRERDAFTENVSGLDPGFIDTYSARAQLQYVTPNFMALLTGDYFTSDNGMTPHFLSTAFSGSILTPAAAAALPTGQTFYRRYYDTDGYEQQDTFAITGRMEWELGDTTLTSISAYRDNQFSRLQDQDGSAAAGYRLRSEEADRTFSQELRLSGDSDRLQWVLGLYYYHAETDRIDQVPTGSAFVVPALQNTNAIYDSDITIDSYAAFGQLTYYFTDALSATFGGRYTLDEKELDQTNTPRFGAPYNTLLTPDWDSFDPAFTLSYQASPDVMVYFSARQGFKSGGFQSLPATAAIAATIYNPERVVSYELGLRSRTFDNRLQVNASVFRAQIDDQQILRIPAPSVTFIDNAGETVTDGIDVSISAAVTPRFSIDWNTTLQAARYEVYACPTCTPAYDFSGKQQIRSPDFMSSLIMEYTQPIGVGDLRFRGDYFYQSEMFFDTANTRVDGYYQPSYGLLGARITFTPEQGNWDLSVFGKNLTDEEYFRNIVPVSGTGVGTPGDPMTVGVSLNWRM